MTRILLSSKEKIKLKVLCKGKKRNLFVRNTEFQLLLNRNKDRSQLGGESKHYWVFEACAGSQWKSIVGSEVLLDLSSRTIWFGDRPGSG